MRRQRYHCHWKLVLLTIFYFTQQSKTKMIRNSALMNRMVSHFQKDKPPVEQAPTTQEPEKILSIMQSVLCRNFPTIPCNIIMKDGTLKSLIEKSIQELNYKKLILDQTTPDPSTHIFPIINSEDLSNFLNVEHVGYFDKKKTKDSVEKKAHKKRRKNAPKTLKNFWSHEKLAKKNSKKKDAKPIEMNSGRKKIHKFYPHKIKYKDKKNGREMKDYSDEKISMSVEVPDLGKARKNQLTYKVDSDDPPVWRIDYMKHGEPSLNMFAYQDDRLKGKIIKTGPSVIVDENVLEQASRKEVLHPDVYIKKKYVRKAPVERNSEGE